MLFFVLLFVLLSFFSFLSLDNLVSHPISKVNKVLDQGNVEVSLQESTLINSEEELEEDDDY